MPFLIYKATNIVNGKVYIGLTSRSLKDRIKGHKADALTRNYNTPFHHAIRKYGFVAFEWVILHQGIPDRIEAQNAEKIFIEAYKSQDRDFGYNVTSGGDGLDPSDHETIIKITNSVNRYYASFDRNKHSRDRGGKPILVYEAILIQRGCGHPNPRQATYKKGNLISRFESQIEACEFLKLSKAHVCQCLSGIRRSHKGYIFEIEAA